MAYCQERKHTDIAQADGWSERLITSLWHMGTASWIFRNSELYGNSAEEQHTKQLKQVDNQKSQRYKYDTHQVRERIGLYFYYW